jgi:hypothetical protein
MLFQCRHEMLRPTLEVAVLPERSALSTSSSKMALKIPASSAEPMVPLIEFSLNCRSRSIKLRKQATVCAQSSRLS